MAKGAARRLTEIARGRRIGAPPQWNEEYRGAFAGHDPAIPGANHRIYWPFKGEFDARPLVRELITAGVTGSIAGCGSASNRHWNSGNGHRIRQWNLASTAFPIPENAIS
jgi:hypothetical protein